MSAIRKPNGYLNGLGKTLVGLLVLITIVVLCLGGVGACGALKGWQRGQARADAQNQVAITKIHIARERAQVQVVTADNGVVNAQAQQRYLEAVGVKRAQVEIAKTLTPLYIQYEQVKAEQAVATSGRNNTVVYVPSGTGGVPTITAAAGQGK